MKKLIKTFARWLYATSGLAEEQAEACQQCAALARLREAQERNTANTTRERTATRILCSLTDRNKVGKESQEDVQRRVDAAFAYADRLLAKNREEAAE